MVWAESKKALVVDDLHWGGGGGEGGLAELGEWTD